MNRGHDDSKTSGTLTIIKDDWDGSKSIGYFPAGPIYPLPPNVAASFFARVLILKENREKAITDTFETCKLLAHGKPVGSFE